MGLVRRAASAVGNVVTGVVRALDVVTGFHVSARSTPSQRERARFDELEKLVELRDRGVLSRQEFETRKARLRP